MDEQRREERFIQDVRLLATVYGSMFNVSELSAREDPEYGIVLEATGAEQLPDFLAEVILGTMNYLRKRIGADRHSYELQRKSRSHWTYQRPWRIMRLARDARRARDSDSQQLDPDLPANSTTGRSRCCSASRTVRVTVEKEHEHREGGTN
jgi:hypothetical protein